MFSVYVLLVTSADIPHLSGGILTVADDLLKNDGQKFLEMMEQLADKRIQRERDIPYAQITNIPSNDNTANESEDGSYDEDEEEEYVLFPCDPPAFLAN